MLFKNLKYIISILVSIYLFQKIGQQIYLNFSGLKILKNYLGQLTIIILLFFPIFYLLTLKLILLIKNIKSIKFFASLNATLIAYNYNLFLPAKSGDFFRHKYLDLKISFKNFFKINIVEKLISFFVLFCFVFFSYLLSNLDFSEIVDLSKLYISFIFFLILIGNLYFIKKFINKENYLKSKFLNLLSFDILIWSLQFFQLFLIINILGIKIDIFGTIFIFGISIIVGLIPISIGGFGVRDYVIFFFFTNMNIEANIFLVLILFNIRYLLPVLIGLIFSIKSFQNEKK